jgi:hypothetical protein
MLTVGTGTGTCLLRSAVHGFDAIDYNTPVRCGYRVMAPSQNRNRRFKQENQHSLLPAGGVHATGARRLAMPRRGARDALRWAARNRSGRS